MTPGLRGGNTGIYEQRDLVADLSDLLLDLLFDLLLDLVADVAGLPNTTGLILIG
jgi:hypothetical protein